MNMAEKAKRASDYAQCVIDQENRAVARKAEQERLKRGAEIIRKEQDKFPQYLEDIFKAADGGYRNHRILIRDAVLYETMGHSFIIENKFVDYTNGCGRPYVSTPSEDLARVNTLSRLFAKEGFTTSEVYSVSPPVSMPLSGLIQCSHFLKVEW